MILVNMIGAQPVTGLNGLTRSSVLIINTGVKLGLNMLSKRVTAQQMKKLDRIAIKEYGIPGVVLMENAGIQAVTLGLEMLSDGTKAVIFCGKGNNGGDGFVIARHFLNKGLDIEVYLTAGLDIIKGDALINLNILLKMGQTIEDISDIVDQQELKHKVADTCLQADLIVDALLGTGISGQITQPYQTIIEIINNSQKPILAIDTPSGLDVNTGHILGVCVKARRTVTFGLAKKGFYLNEGPQYCGELVIADISLPRNIIEEF